MIKKISIKVIPRSSINKIIDKNENGVLKIKLTAPPIDDKANKMLIKFLSAEWGIPKSKIKIIYGETSKNKIIKIED